MKKKSVNNFGRFINRLTLAFINTITTRPIRFMLLYLHHTLMLFMTQKNTILTNSFNLTSLTMIKIR
jgi:hypothetical protein